MDCVFHCISVRKYQNMLLSVKKKAVHIREQMQARVSVETIQECGSVIQKSI